MKILNLFAGIGGNRTLWNGHEVTAIDNNRDIAMIYKKRFPDDIVGITDAYEYLEHYYFQYDFIWASPPCTSHSVMVFGQNHNPLLPDLRLYSLILFLDAWFEGNWVVENVRPYYKPLIKETFRLGRHLFWSNFLVPKREFKMSFFYEKIDTLCELFQVKKELIDSFNPERWKNHDPKGQILRNCVHPEIGKYILDQVLKKNKLIQTKL